MPFLGLPVGEDKFTALLGNAADNIVAVGHLLVETMRDFEHLEFHAGRVRELEHEGDSITHQMMNQLEQSFVTPFDREDLALLTQRMDDVVDHVDAAVTALYDYGIAQPTKRAQELAEVILKAGDAVRDAMDHIERAELRDVLPITVNINSLENQADQLFRSAMRELFEEPDVRDIIKWRDVYRELEAATDSVEDVANVMEGIVLKYS
jgi:uncharacterized protein